MKRLLTILLFILPALSLSARDYGKPYTIEHEVLLPGVNKYEITKRADAYFEKAAKQWNTSYDFRFNLDASARKFWYINHIIHSGKRDYRCDIIIEVSITPDKNGNKYKVRMDRVKVYARRRGWLILEDYFGLGEDDTHDYDGYLHKKRVYNLAQDVKAFAASEFEKIFQEIKLSMTEPTLDFNFDLVR